MGKKLILAAGCWVALMQAPARAENASTNSAAATTNSAAANMDKKEKLSYAIGMSVGGNLKRGSYDVDVEVLAAAIKDTLAGRTPKLTEGEERDTLMSYQREMQAKRQEEQHKLAEKNAQAGEEFLAQNKMKDGVKSETATLPGPGNKTAEWQYKVITEGSGPMPNTNDMVTVAYHGKTLDGKEFDNSSKRPQSSKLSPGRDFIRGRGAALLKMKAGSKWEIYLPASLAYGDRGSAGVDPGAAVMYELELVSIDTPQPLTSDIIRVPSQEGLKKGEKVEVLKNSDVERMIKEGNTNGAAK